MDGSIDELLDPEYLGDLQSRPIDEIRAMRAECQRVEVSLSYLRRLGQGRLDIVAAELARRTEGGAAGDVSHLVDDLPKILGEQPRPAGPGRLPTYLAPSDIQDATAEIDAVVDAGVLASLPDRDEQEVRSIADRLRDYEQRVSALRRALHANIDALQAELARRYKTGEASVETLLQ